MDESAEVRAAVDCAELPDFRLRIVQYPKAFRQPTHTHDRPSLTLVLSGTIEEVQNGTSQVAMPFSVIVKKAQVPHSDRFGPDGSKTLQISLPAAFELDECVIDTERVIWHTDGGAPIVPLLRLVKYIQRNSGVSASDVSLSVYEALGAFPNRDRISINAPLWLQRVKALIDEADPVRPLSMARLQKQAAVHPVHITRQFKRHFGCSVRDYMQYRRVRATVTLIAQGALTLTEVAHQCAFADQPHFCRAFRSIAGVSPRDYRMLTKMVGGLKVENVQVIPAANRSSLLWCS